MPVYEKVKPKRVVKFLPIQRKRKINPVTGELVVAENWTPQTIRTAPKGVGKKQRKRPVKQRKQLQAA